MEIILLEDVANLGKKYDTVEVADGYGMNYLLPQGKARTATDRAQAEIKEEKKRLEERRKARREELAEKLGEIDGEHITFSRKANEQGSLFAGIDAKVIADEIADEFDIELETRFINLTTPIKQVGIHEVGVEIEGKSATVMIDVTGA